MEPTDQPTNPASGVQVTDVVDATVVKAHVTTTASIEQDNAVKSPSPHEAPSPSSPSPETLLTAQIEQDVQGAIEPITGGVSTVIGMATAHIDPDLVDEPAVALAGAKSAVSRLHTMIHNIGNVAEMPYEGLKALFGDLGKFLSKL